MTNDSEGNIKSTFQNYGFATVLAVINLEHN